MKSPEHIERRRRRVQRIALWSVLLLLLLGVLNFWAGVGLRRDEARIALITVDGVILSSRSFVEQIERYREDKGIEAMVVRVDSPGGGVAPSQEIHQALRRFREAGKVLVTSMGSVAASGGLYVSLASTKIFANPGTITGSIGVIMEIGNVEDLLKKVGLRVEVVKSGVHKDLGSPVRPLSPEDRAILQQVIDDAYDQFLRSISEGRNLPLEQVRSFADGRIFTGERAKGLGLVDEIGSLDDAIREAGRLAGIVGKPKVVEERPRGGFLGRLLRGSPSLQALGLPLSEVGARLQYRWMY